MKWFKDWLNKFLGTTTVTLPTLASGQIAIPEYIVTNGIVSKVDETLYVESPTARISFPTSDGEKLYFKAKYLGPSESSTAFASGSIVQQVGIKLRDVNQCNLVYIMRRITPVSNVTIQIKENPGMSTHQECGSNGYTTLANISMPPVAVNDEVSLSARFDSGNTLVVWCNGQKVFNQPVPFGASGIAGIRTDNIRSSIRLFE